MPGPTYPIFLFDGLDLLIISSFEKLQGDVESVDAQSEDYEVFDSTGRRVRLETVGSRIDAQTDPAESVQDFAGKLRSFLRAVGDRSADNPECDLWCLMDACRKRV